MKNKFVAFTLLTSLAVATCFTGCGKEEVDYDIEIDSEEADASSGSILATNLGVPDSCEESLDVGSSGLTSITMDCDHISTPDSDSMSYITCKRMVFDSEYKKNLCESIFDDDYGVYVYDEEHQAEEDLQSQIDYYGALKSSAVSLGDSDYEEIYQGCIDELEALQSGAVSELTPAGDYSADEYLGCINGMKFTISFGDEENYYNDYYYVSSEIRLNYYLESELMEYRPYDGAVGISMIGTNDDVDNTCELASEGAETVVFDFLASFGIENVTMESVGTMGFEYSDGANNILATEYDGYYMEFSRSINGETVTGGSILDPTVNNSGSVLTSLPLFKESYTVYVDANGVLSMSANFVVSEENEEKNVNLISWDELMDVLNSGAAEYFSGIKTSYNEIVLNDIELTYMLLKDNKNEDTYNYTPVWILTQNDDADYESSDADDSSDAYKWYSEVTIIVNAMDGTIYNIDDIY